MSAASQHINNYLEEAEKNKENIDFTDLENIKKLQQAVATGNWDSFKSASKDLNWNIDNFLLTESDKKEIAEASAAKENALKQAKATENINAVYNQLQLTPEQRASISSTYTEEDPE